MNYEDFKTLIVHNGNSEDWLYDEYHQVYTLKENLSVSIHFCKERGTEEVSKDWFTKTGSSQGRELFFDIHLGASLIEQLRFYELDNGNILMPEADTLNTVSEYHYSLTRALNKPNAKPNDSIIDEYFDRLGWSIYKTSNE